MRVHLRARLLLVALLALPQFTFAQGASKYQQLTVSTTAVGLATATKVDATVCRGTLEAAPIRVLFDGTTPTATSGQPVALNDEIVLGNVADITNFKAIAIGAASGTLNITCSVGTAPGPSYVRPAATVTPSPLTAQQTYSIQQSATDLRSCQTANATAIVNTQATLTLTPPAGQYVYLCGLDATVSQNGSASVNTNLTFTSTNLGGWLWKYSSPATVNGAVQYSLLLPPGLAIKSAVPGTAVTVVSPSGVTNSAFSISAYYRFAQ